MKQKSKLIHWLCDNLKLNWFTLPVWLFLLNKAMEIMSQGTFDDFAQTQRPLTWLKDCKGDTPFETVEVEMSYWDTDE